MRHSASQTAQVLEVLDVLLIVAALIYSLMRLVAGGEMNPIRACGGLAGMACGQLALLGGRSSDLKVEAVGPSGGEGGGGTLNTIR